MTRAPLIRVLIAEPDAATRIGVRMALESHGFEIRAEALDLEEAVSAAAHESVDLCLLDAALPGGGIDATRRIMDAWPQTTIVLLGSPVDDEQALEAISAGAVGFLPRDMNPARLPHALRGVVDGEAALSRRMTRRLIDAYRARGRLRSMPAVPGAATLSEREWQVLELLAAGVPTSEVARRLAISDVTVRRHVSAAVAKLGLADREAALSLLRERSRA